MNVLSKHVIKQLRRTAISLALLACLLFVRPGIARAAEPIDTSRICSLSLVCKYGTVSLSNMTVKLYRVADGNGETGFTLSGAFSSLPVNLSGLSSAGWNNAAATLASYIQPNNITEDRRVQTDASGSVSMANLTQGLYLITGDTLRIGTHTYTFAPFLVALPNASTTGDWVYDVTAYPKTADPADHEPNYFDVTVLLQWSDAGTSAVRPTSVDITLLRNGVVYQNYTLSAANNWRHTWTNLSDVYNWSVVQTTKLSDYTVTYQRSGTTLVITDTAKPAATTGTTDTSNTTTTRDSSIPQTGMLWWPIYSLAGAGMILFAIGWRRRFRGRGKQDVS